MDSVEYLKNIVIGLVDSPDSVRIEKTIDEMGVLLSIGVAREDMGKIIGKEGGTAKAIRLIMNGHGFKQRQKVSVKILEPLRA